MLAGAVMLLSIGGCGRDADRPGPSPGSPRPSVALPSAVAVVDRDAEVTPAASKPTGLFGAPGALPAAERHFELYQRMNEETAPLIKASLPAYTSPN
jgi:hypothetical protein